MTSVRVAAAAEVDQRISGDLGREAGAAAALDAALTVEQDEVADRDRLLEVPLLLDEARLARTERERLVLERALAAAVADRAVERVVDEEELEHAVLHGLDRRALRAHDHAVGDGRRAGDLEAAQTLDLDEAHPAHADRLHALVVTEARDVGAVLLRDLDQQLTARRLDLAAVDRDLDDVGAGRDRDQVAVVRRPLAHLHRVGSRHDAARICIAPRFSVSRRMRSRISSREVVAEADHRRHRARPERADGGLARRPAEPRARCCCRS